MLTFTLPAGLRPACILVPEKIYPLFFQCAAEAIKDILANPKHFGIQAGFFGVVQTWQQNLTLHPHIHFVVPAGGLDPDGNLIIAKKQWLAWGGIFAMRLKNLLLTQLKAQAIVEQATIDECWKIEWNADVENFGNGHNAIKYLGRYIYKSAISDARIIHIDDTHVTFTLKNTDTKKTSTSASPAKSSCGVTSPTSCLQDFTASATTVSCTHADKPLLPKFKTY